MPSRSLTAIILSIVVIASTVTVAGTFLVAEPASGQSPVIVDSDITSDTTWATATGPYRIVESVNISKGATLTVEPGVTVELAEGVVLRANGEIKAVGTADSAVVFTSSKSEPTPGSWGTIQLAGSYSQIHHFRHTRIEYATDGLTLAGGQRVLVEESEIENAAEAAISGTTNSGFAPTGDITVRDSTLRHNGFGIRGYDESVTVTDTIITENSRAGIHFAHMLNVLDLTVRDSNVSKNDVGIHLASDVDKHNRGGEISGITIRHTAISANAGAGLEVFGDRLMDISIVGASLTDNGGTGLHLQDTGSAGGAKPSRNITVADTEASQNGHFGMEFDAAFSTWDRLVLKGLTAHDNDATGIRVDADRSIRHIQFTATEASRNNGTGIHLTANHAETIAVSGSEVFGNAASGVRLNASTLSSIGIDETHAAANQAAGILVEGTGEGNVTTISSSTIAGNHNGIQIHDHTAIISQSSIEYNDEIGLLFTGPRTRDNVVSATDSYGNGVALTANNTNGGTVVYATENYWGASSGPYHASVNPEGDGDTVIGSLERVKFLPYAKEPYGEIHEAPKAKLEVSTNTVPVGSELSLDASGSSDDGSVEWYRFKVNNSSDSGLVPTDTLTHTFDNPGTYRVNLTVLDNKGVPSQSQDAVVIHVVNKTDEANGTTSDTDSNSNNNNNNSGSDSNGNQDESGVQTPGFGVITALLAILVAVSAITRIRD